MTVATGVVFLGFVLFAVSAVLFLSRHAHANVEALRQDNERLVDTNRQSLQHLTGMVDQISRSHVAALNKQAEAQSMALQQVVAVVSESERRLMEVSSNAPVGGLSPGLWEQEHQLKLMRHELDKKKLEFQMEAQMPEIDRRRLIVEREQQKRSMKDRARVTQ